MPATHPPSDLARRINRAFLTGQIDELEFLVHEDAQVAGYLNPGAIISGREAIIAASRLAREETVFSVSLTAVRDLSDTVAVGTGSVRYPKDEHTTATVQAAWLWKFKDGKLLRGVHYMSEDDALSAYDSESDDFGMPSSLPLA